MESQTDCSISKKRANSAEESFYKSFKSGEKQLTSC